MRTLTTVLGLVAVTVAVGCDDGSTTPIPAESAPPSTRPVMTVVSGDRQTGEVGAPLPDPLVVRVADTAGIAIPGVAVRFLVDGVAQAGSSATDRDGLAAHRWTLGPAASAQRMVARATLPAGTASVTFIAVGTAGPPARIAVVSRNNDVALPGAVLDTVRALVTDRFANPTQAVSVNWVVRVGGGSVVPAQNGTDAQGVSRALWTIGPTEGPNELEVRVSGATARISATGGIAFEAASLTVGGGHTCALTATGRAYCWGINSSGQLGVGGSDDVPHPSPRRVGGNITFASLVAGAVHTCGLTSSGEAFCWGGYGAGTISGPPGTPTRVTSALSFTALTAGGHHTCGLTSTGTVYCWGDNALGQLGDGSDRSTASWLGATGRPTPEPVASGHSFVALAAGYHTTCAISADGSTHCWGGGSLGELAAPASSMCRILASPYYYDVEYFDLPCSTSPTQTTLPRSLSSLAIRGYGHCGVSTTAELVCWGYGWSAPRVIPGAHVSEAWVVANNVCGLEVTGSVSCWSVWSRPDIGIVRPFGDHLSLVDLDSSGSHSCGIARDHPRVVYCWDNNAGGSLGDGTTYYRVDPVKVVVPRDG